MHTFLQPLFVLVLFVLVRSGDIAIGALVSKNTVRAICYGSVALLALLVTLFALLGVTI